MANGKISSLNGLYSIESRLAAAPKKEFDSSYIEDGSPLAVEIEMLKEEHGSDLSGLPPGHPIFRILEEAKARYELRKDSGTQKTVKPTTVKRTATKNVMQTDDTEAKRVLAAHKINSAMQTADDALKMLMREIVNNENIISTERIGKLKIFRLKKMVDAMRRLIGDSKIPGARA